MNKDNRLNELRERVETMYNKGNHLELRAFMRTRLSRHIKEIEYNRADMENFIINGEGNLVELYKDMVEHVNMLRTEKLDSSVPFALMLCLGYHINIKDWKAVMNTCIMLATVESNSNDTDYTLALNDLDIIVDAASKEFMEEDNAKIHKIIIANLEKLESLK